MPLKELLLPRVVVSFIIVLNQYMGNFLCTWTVIIFALSIVSSRVSHSRKRGELGHVLRKDLGVDSLLSLSNTTDEMYYPILSKGQLTLLSFTPPFINAAKYSGTRASTTALICDL